MMLKYVWNSRRDEPLQSPDILQEDQSTLWILTG